MKKNNFVFLGSPVFSITVLNDLLANNLKPLVVFTPKDKPVGRKQTLTPVPLKQFCHKKNIPVSHDLSEIKKIKPTYAIVVAFGKIIKKEILNACLFINLHPSLLPKYRGPSPLQYAILNNDKATGISLMLLDEGMDTGPIILQSKYQIKDTDNWQILGDKLFKLGSQELLKILLADNYCLPRTKKQDENKASYTKLIKREDGLLKKGDNLHSKLRAFSGWPGVFTFFKNKRLKILDLQTVQLEGAKPVLIETFIKQFPDVIPFFREISLLH